MSKDGYKEIKIGGAGVTIEFDDDTAITPKAEEKIIEDVNLEDIVETPAEKKEIKEEVKEKAKPAKGSRANKRIRQLNAEKQEALLEAQKTKEENAELKRRLQEGDKSSKTSLKGTLENQIKTLTNSLRTAMESGDSENVIALQDDLINAKMELAGVSHELKNNESLPPIETKPTAPAQPQMPEQALDWMDEHPTFNSDPIFRASTIAVNNQLISEGFNTSTDEFYAELNSRLSKRFPEEFGVEDKNDVESKEDTKLSSDDQVDVKEKSSPTKTRSVEQTVSGSSRPSTVSVNSPIKKNSVTLSPQDVEQAERWGLSLEQMARRMAHSANNKRVDGYVPIQIG